jgi:hypothetical protein
VTATTSYSVSLVWNPSTDNSGTFSYVICCAGTQRASVPQTATSFTFTAGLEAGRPYSLRIWAVDAAGNYSGPSNTVSGTLPSDVTPPTKPLLSVTDVGPGHVTLAFSSIEDGPNVWYQVFQDGSPFAGLNSGTSAIITPLEPATTHTFTVQARDFASNWSPLSDPVTVTTEQANLDDTTPPTTPANFREMNWGCETELQWDESTDDLDPQWALKYDVYVNDVYDHTLTLRVTRTIVYGTFTGPNTFSVVAVDTAGNKSQPATLTTHLDCGF